MRRDLVESISTELAGRVFHAVIAGVLLVFLTRMLGPESYGIYALALSIFMVSRLFSEQGIARSAARYLAEFKDDRPEAADTVVTESKRIAIVSAVTVSLLLAVTADWIATLLDEPSLSLIIVVGSGYVLFYSLHEYNRVILQGYERVAISAKLHALEAALTGFFVVIFVLYRPTATSAVFGYAVGFGVVTAVGFYIISAVRDSAAEGAASSSKIRGRILRYNVPITVTNLSDVVDRQMDVLLVGYFLNPLAVAYYMIGKEVSRLLIIPGASIGFAISPKYGAEKAAGRLESAASIYEESLRQVLIFYVPACTGIVLVTDVVILTIFGEGYAGAIPVVQILALFILFEGFSNISNDTLDYVGKARVRAIVKFATSIANFGLNLLLIPIIGVEGAAIATVITHGLYSLTSVYLMYSEIAFDLALIRRCFVRVSVVTLVMGAVVYSLVQAFTGFVAIFVGVGVGTGIWLVGCQAFALFDFREVMAMIQN